MTRKRRRPKRGAEVRVWATSIADPELARDSAVMLEALKEVAATIEPRPDPVPGIDWDGLFRRLGEDTPPSE